MFLIFYLGTLVAKANAQLVVIDSAMLPQALGNTVGFRAFRTQVQFFRG